MGTLATVLFSEQLTEATQDRLRMAFIIAVGISIVLPRLPFGRKLLYPFALLSTWAHELGHGVAAVLAGGRFTKLEVYPDLGGTAYSSGVRRGVPSAFVSAGGLIGPAFAGGLVIIAGSRPETAPYVLAAIAASVLASVVLVLRNQFGVLTMSGIGAVLALVAWQGPETLRLLLAQLIGIQFCFASWGTLDYMFTKNFPRDGYLINSDTQNISEQLAFPYWFWAFWVAVISAIILVFSFYVAWVRPEFSTV